MVRKSTFTMACMLMTVGCANLQTNEASKVKTGERSNNDFSPKNNAGNENVVVEIVGGKKEKAESDYSASSNSSEQRRRTNKSEDAVRKPEKKLDKHSDLNEKIDDLKVTRLFDENKLVDRSMPNSQLVLQKLSELKRKHQEILLNGTFSQKKTVKLQNQLLKSYSNWKGTKYSLGGDSEDGMDCSALTRRVYREVYGYELPRQTVQQVKVGAHVSKENLKPGDIVFFRPEEKNNHTAVYLGDTLFINASASKGVVISTLENTYWNKYFKYGVRIREV